MAEEQPQLSRDEVRQLIDAARERLAERRAEMAQDQSPARTIAQRYYDGLPVTDQLTKEPYRDVSQELDKLPATARVRTPEHDRGRGFDGYSY